MNASKKLFEKIFKLRFVSKLQDRWEPFSIRNFVIDKLQFPFKRSIFGTKKSEIKNRPTNKETFFYGDQ
jgi:hypothetical protein